MLLINAADGEHADEYMQLGDQLRVTGEQGFQLVRFVGFHYKVDPGGGDIDPGQLIHDLIDLYDHDAVFERRCFDDGGCFFRVWAGIQVAQPVSFVGCDQCDIRNKIDKQPSIQFEISVDLPDLQAAIFDHLRDAQTLRTGERKIYLFGDAEFEDVKMLRTGNARHDHV